MSTQTTAPEQPAAQQTRGQTAALVCAVILTLSALLTALIGGLVFAVGSLNLGGQYGGLPVIFLGIPLMCLSGLLSIALLIVYAVLRYKTRAGNVITAIGVAALAMGLVLVLIPYGQLQASQARQLAALGEPVEHTVTYEITGPGPVDLLYSGSNEAGNSPTMELRDVSLPWHTSVKIVGYEHNDQVIVSLGTFRIADAKTPVRCRILVDGKVVGEDESYGHGDDLYCQPTGFHGDTSALDVN